MRCPDCNVTICEPDTYENHLCVKANPTQPTEAQGDDALGGGVDILGCKADEMFSEVETAVDEVEALTRKLRGTIEKCVVQVVNECADSLAKKHRDHAAALKASHADEIAKAKELLVWAFQHAQLDDEAATGQQEDFSDMHDKCRDYLYPEVNRV